MKESRLIKFLKKLLTEVSTIMLGLLLALALNSWKEDKDREHNAKVLVASINKEIKKNYQSVLNLKKNLDIQVQKNDSLISLYEEGVIKTLGIVTITHKLQSVAWKSANASEDFSVIPSPTLIGMAKVYEEQERADLIMKSIDNYYINNNPEQSSLTRSKIKQNHMKELLSRCKDLERRYKEYTRTIKI